MKKGDRFGRLTVVVTPQGRAVSVVCSCGVCKVVNCDKLVTGHTRSCGCLRNEKIGAVNRRHCLTGSRLYACWKSMKYRCSNPRAAGWHNYGGRGICVCREWQSFDVFAYWAFANGYNDELTLDRKRTNRNYCPSNCRWATYKQQSQSRRKRRGMSTPYLGVCRCVGETLYSAYANRKRLGRFVDSFSAAWVRDVYVKQHSDPYVTLNSLRDRRKKQKRVKLERRGTFDWDMLLNK
jgi:hypothetical protein